MNLLLLNSNVASFQKNRPKGHTAPLKNKTRDLQVELAKQSLVLSNKALKESETSSDQRKAADRPKGHAAPIKKIIPTVGSGLLKKGSDILSHITAVPSAQSGLTSLFGMGRGEPRRNNHLKF